MALPNPGMNFTPFDVLPASDLNDIVENVEALADGSAFDSSTVFPFSGAWTSYTPTWTGGSPAIGNGTLQIYWRQIGKHVDVRFNLSFGTTTNSGSGAWTFTLPTAAVGTYPTFTALAGAFLLERPGTADYQAIPVIVNATTWQMFYDSGSTIAVVGSASPVGWNNTSFMRGSFSYEAA